MASQVKLRGGTSAEHSNFIGAQREVTVDTTNNTLRVHDGLTAGGTRLAKHSELFSGSYNDLVNKPSLFSGSYEDLTSKPSLFSGSYNDLSNKPSLFSGSYNDLTGRPTLFSGSYNDLTSKPALFSGSYTDLTNKPALFSGSYSDLTNKPSLFSGSYNDLSDKPTIPSDLGDFSNSPGYLTSSDLPTAGAGAGNGGDQIFHLSDAVATTSYAIPVGKNALVAGPLEIQSGVEITVPANSHLVIL